MENVITPMWQICKEGHSIISPEKAIDHIQSPEQLPFSKPEEQ